MSILEDLVGSSNIGTQIFKTVLTGYALKKVTESINKSNEARAEANKTLEGSRLQLDPTTDERIPVLYGTAFVPGIITEAVQSADQKTMYMVITLSERTGTLFSDSSSSTYTFANVYANDNRCVFETSGAGSGLSVTHTLDADGNRDDSFNGLLKIYPFAGSSGTPQVFDGYTNSTTLADAHEIVPGWTSDHAMQDLIFAVVEITYNSDRGVTTLPKFTFEISNSMTLPGDCLFDYMTNTRYGAGIDPDTIFQS